MTLRTVPVDPIDLFRGRYVTLRYEISALPTGAPDGTTVYVPLRDGGRSWVGGLPTTQRPEGTFVRGVVDGGSIRFGIERYFTDEDEARRLEAAGPLLVELVLDEKGTARIAGVRPVG